MVPVEGRLAPLTDIDVVVDQPLSHTDPRQILEQKEATLSPDRLGVVVNEVELGLATELRYHVVAKRAGEWVEVPTQVFPFAIRAQVATTVQGQTSPRLHALYMHMQVLRLVRPQEKCAEPQVLGRTFTVT